MYLTDTKVLSTSASCVPHIILVIYILVLIILFLFYFFLYMVRKQENPKDNHLTHSQADLGLSHIITCA